MGVSGSIVYLENAISDPMISTFEGVRPKSGSFTHDWWKGSTLSDFTDATRLLGPIPS